jgi:hypothetical protein
MPGSRRLNSAGSDVGGNRRTEFQNPTADCFIAHIDPALGKHFLDVPKAQWKSKIEPDGSLNYGGRKSVACVRYFSHSKTIICRDADRRVNVTMPLEVTAIGWGASDALSIWLRQAKERYSQCIDQ